MTKEVLCIYHGDCMDGFTGAWVVRKYYQENPQEGSVTFHPGVYGKNPPDCTDKDVVLVDFSYDRETTLKIADEAKSLLILDHHKTAIERLTDLPENIKTVFDITKSGARVAWNYYFPEEAESPPHLLQHVEDYDLWKFELNYTKSVVNYIRSMEYDFDTWDRLMKIDSLVDHDDYFEIVNSGRAIERIEQKQIKEFSKNKVIVNIGNKFVPALNLPYFYSSTAAGMLAKEHDFGVTFWYTNTGVTFSLRSTVESGVDVAKIAEGYGGGGHKNASGFSVDFQQFSDMLMHVEYVKE